MTGTGIVTVYTAAWTTCQDISQVNIKINWYFTIMYQGCYPETNLGIIGDLYRNVL